MKICAKPMIAPAAIFLALALAGPGLGARKAAMKPTRPVIGQAFTYLKSGAKGERIESHVERVEELEVGSAQAFQRILGYPDRVVRATVRQSDLAPSSPNTSGRTGPEDFSFFKNCCNTPAPLR